MAIKGNQAATNFLVESQMIPHDELEKALEGCGEYGESDLNHREARQQFAVHSQLRNLGAKNLWAEKKAEMSQR
jgi:hypothetical protein